MALRIMRLDKREETRAGEIVKDWRKWATDNGYIKKKSLPVEQGRMSITLEIWERLQPPKIRISFIILKFPQQLTPKCYTS
jgi:hypothetical protein